MPLTDTRLRPRPLQLLLACTLLHTASVNAQPSRGAEEPRTWLTLLGVAAHWQMQTRGDTTDYFGSGSTLPGTRISTEDDLGLPRRKAVAGIVFGRRIGQHWRVEVGHTTAQRQGSAVLSRELQVDGYVFAAGSTLESKIGLTTLSVLGGWSTTVGEATEAGVLLGGQWVRVSRRMWPKGTPPSEAGENADVAPEPVVGGFIQHPLAARWRLDGRVTASPGGNYQATAGVQWLAHRHGSLGLGYRVTRHQLDLESFTLIGPQSRIAVDAKIHGPILTATLAF